MSIDYYLYAKSSREVIPMGNKNGSNGIGYQGPLLWIAQDRYWLPEKYLSLIVKRFNEQQANDEVLICSDYELFDTDKYVPEEETIFIVGGDRDCDPSLEKYLPEIKQPNVIAEIMADDNLKIK